MYGPHGVRFLPRVVPVVEFREVPVQVLLADMMVYPIDPAFQYPEISLDAVGREADPILIAETHHSRNATRSARLCLKREAVVTSKRFNM